MITERIQDRARGRWRSLLPQLGVAESFLSNKHGPCPMCGGTDRWRWDDKAGSGSWICSHCGAGSGVDLVMRVNGCEFLPAKRMIEDLLPSTVVAPVKAERVVDVDRLRAIWRTAEPLTGTDPASWYLTGRGLSCDTWPTQLRFLPRATYVHDDKTKTQHPALVAHYVSPDASEMTLHFTYLDSVGRKASVPKVRKLAAGKMPRGGAVRLANSAETMGVAEGIETALSASKMFDVPVWATLSAGALMKWEPPPTARNVIVFGDSDTSLTGQLAAYSLAYRLRKEGINAEVRLPDQMDSDWNDMLGVLSRPETIRMEAAE